MDLLSAKDKADILSATGDIFDTFFKDEIQILQKDGVFSRFSNFDNDQTPETDMIRGMVVWGKDKNSVHSDSVGTVDESEGYVIIPFGEAELSGMVEKISAGEDKIIVKGEELKIIGVYPAANLAGQFVLLKVYFKREL